MESIEFDIEKMRSEVEVSDEWFRNLSVDITNTRSPETNHLYVQLIKRMASFTKQDYVSDLNMKEYPKTWWDHLKHRFSFLGFLFGSPNMEVIATRKTINYTYLLPNVKKLNDAIELQKSDRIEINTRFNIE